MPTSAIPGFVKKRTASQRYNRSPRQLTRDITVALAMRDDATLGHLRIRTEDGETIEGSEVSSELVKELRDGGRNPMWYLRASWLEETFGRREPGDKSTDEPEPATQREGETGSAAGSKPTSDDGLTEMLKDTIRELKDDKHHLIDQIKIKDDQIKETTERWKESNYIAQGLNQRIEKLEQRQALDPDDISQPAPAQTAPDKADDPNPATAETPADVAGQRQSTTAPVPKMKAKPKKGITGRARNSKKRKPSTTNKRPASKKRGSENHPDFFSWETPTLSRWLKRKSQR